MKICFPVESNEGMESVVFGHFGSAPLFVVVDTESRAVQAVNNGDKDHAHGQCKPLRALGGQQVDAIVVGGIGSGALMGLNRVGLKVFQAQGVTVADNLACLREDSLPELTLQGTCGGHGHGHGCGHDH
ncbi:MAG: NifB/NifX family molybdenum-iron cluster-binding protein [Desulfuromonadales bacterium]|jgi:predicted Fe-Mo cluster-binding NifX family protein|uniref:NifB/NifX family molybdenum-iron cluster-binding protein n=1 Tax=Desulfuromonas sp. KJ2020 TaxID=2919173 RepID=UPI0020A7B39A|nr:NifB/NifX family molybdenum-iron cluster-binding protein [Desulfuromonas sp. KJ2020]MCP3176027.1 NifB/NifX family molybdenum-iron cluster-binding protein [Desulfuromonas sp. KJ2020]